MPVKNICACAVLVFLLGRAAVPQTMAAPQRPEVADTYRIYSLLLGNEMGQGWPLESYAIAQNTVTRGWHIPAGSNERPDLRQCIDVPKQAAKEYESAIADFQTKNAISEPLERYFSLDKPYTLLDSHEVANFRIDGSSPLFSVSRIGLSGDGNVAIVYIQHQCGSMCGGGRFHVLRKQQPDEWIEEKRVLCGWAS